MPCASTAENPASCSPQNYAAPSISGAYFSLIAQHRNPDSYVAEASALHRDPLSPRYSEDVDIFHDPTVRVRDFAAQDLATLRAAGLAVHWDTEHETFLRAWVADPATGERIKLEWARDSAFRFFPVEPDPILGYRLHWADLATNKILAGAGRMVIRDFIDLVFLNDGWLPLGALAWPHPPKTPA
ncbi:MAG: hypothetical protein NTU80_11805 [Verrucomicrobia bacterium]|nr:hypothetical protein [Verrucomicrobiota bacterium]